MRDSFLPFISIIHLYHPSQSSNHQHYICIISKLINICLFCASSISLDYYNQEKQRIPCVVRHKITFDASSCFDLQQYPEKQSPNVLMMYRCLVSFHIIPSQQDSLSMTYLKLLVAFECNFRLIFFPFGNCPAYRTIY